jgi:hypothetical protein
MRQGSQKTHSSTRKNIGMVASLTKDFSKQDVLIAFCLFLFGLITRIPFASRMIYHSDSVRFALAMEHYDVAQMRPHAPGYILYVALGKLADLFVRDARLSLVGVSILASALTLFFLYFLATKMYGPSNGIISALLLLSSPLFWFNGEMPFTYTLEGLFSVIFAYSCYKIIIGEKKWLPVSAIILGLATGVRQNIIIMLLPLWLYSIRKCSLRNILISFIVFGVTCLTWFIPMTALTGGLKKYFTALDAQFKSVVIHPASFLFQIKTRGKIFVTFMIYSLSLGLMPIFYYFGRLFRIPSIVKDIRLKFLLFWFVPGTFFFIGLTIWNPGHVILILPPLFICLAESIKGFSKDLEEGIKNIIEESSNFFKKIFSYKVIFFSSVVLLFLINFYIFLFKDTQVSYAAIHKGDAQLAALVRLTKENFEPEKTMLLTWGLNTQAGFYLPNYLIYCPFPLMFNSSEVPIEAQNVYISFRHQTTPKMYWIPTGFKIKPITIPPGIDTVILWEPIIAKFYQSSDRSLREIDSHINDVKIYFLKVKSKEKIYYDYHFWTVK